MRKIIYLCIIAAVMFNSGCSKDSEKFQGVVTFVYGSLKINNQNAVVGSRVRIDDVVSTEAESLAVIQISQTALITIRSGSELKFVNLMSDKNKSEIVLLYLTKGTIFNKVIKKGTDYSVKTNVIVASVRGTSFEVKVDGEKNKVSLLSGKVKVTEVINSGSADKSLNQGDKTAAKEIELAEGSSIEAAAGKIEEAVLLDKAGIDNLLQYDAIEPVHDVEKTVPAPENADREKNLNLKESHGITVIPETYKDVIIKQEMADDKTAEFKKDGFDPDKSDVAKLMKKGSRTLEDIKKVFKRTDEIYLYSGRVIKGAIVSRGDMYSILTTDGVIKVSGKEIQTVKIVK